MAGGLERLVEPGGKTSLVSPPGSPRLASVLDLGFASGSASVQYSIRYDESRPSRDEVISIIRPSQGKAEARSNNRSGRAKAKPRRGQTCSTWPSRGTAEARPCTLASAILASARVHLVDRELILASTRRPDSSRLNRTTRVLTGLPLVDLLDVILDESRRQPRRVTSDGRDEASAE